MSNNISIGPNAVTAKQTISFTDAGLNSGNCSNVYKVADPLQSWVFGRSLNPITGFVAGQGYYMNMIAAMDLSTYLIPPVTGGVVDPQFFLDNFTGAAGAWTAHTPDKGAGTNILAAFTLDGAGNLTFPSAAAQIIISGTIPTNRKMELLLPVAPNVGTDIFLTLTHNASTSAQCYAYFRRAADSGGVPQYYLTIKNESVELTVSVLIVNPNFPLTFKAQIVDDIITAQITDTIVSIAATELTPAAQFVTIGTGMASSLLVKEL